MRESGAIEQDADIVSFIYRPEYYKIEYWDDDDQTPTEGQAELIVAKHRNGGLDDIRLKFVAELGKFESLESGEMLTEISSSMNISNHNLPDFPSPDEAFGSSINDDGDGIPF